MFVQYVLFALVWVISVGSVTQPARIILFTALPKGNKCVENALYSTDEETHETRSHSAKDKSLRWRVTAKNC